MSTEDRLPDSVQRSKYRLQRRIEEAKTTRTDVLTGFQQKIDSVVSKPIKAAEYLISNPNVSSDELNAASLQLCNCSEFIWSLLIKVCEMMEKNEVHSPQICMGFNEIAPRPQGLYICSIPNAAINLNYVPIESQSEMDALRQSSHHHTVKKGIVDGGKLGLEERNSRVDEIMNQSESNADISARGGETDQNDVAIDENYVPISSASPVSQYKLNTSFVNSLLMSDGDSSLLAHDTTPVTSQESLAANDQCPKSASNLNHSSTACINTVEKHHQQWERIESDTHPCHNKQAITHGKSLFEAHQYESDRSNSSKKIAISHQDSLAALENSRCGHSEHGSGRNIGLCHQAIRHEKTLVGAYQCKQDGFNTNRKSTTSYQDSPLENSHHDQSQLDSVAQNKSEMCESIRKNTIPIQDLGIANSEHSSSHQVNSSDESQRANLFNPDSEDIDPKNENSSKIVNSELDDKPIGLHLNGDSATAMPANNHHANGAEHDQTRSDSFKSLEMIDEPAVGANHFRCMYRSDPESGTDTVYLSFDPASLSPGHAPATSAISVEKEQCKPASKECVISRSDLQHTFQATSRNEFEFEFVGLISDIATPSSFSIQRKSDLQQLQILGYNLNKYFNCPEQIDQGLRIQTAPLAGECIAAKYTVDGNWYRGLVLQVTGIHTVIVRYIDYGNTDEILWQKAFKLPKIYQDIPPISMKCSLAGIRPSKSKKGDGDGIRLWDEQALKWFDGAMLNKTVNVIPVHKTTHLLHVQLFTNRQLTGSNECISDVMVEIGLAQYDIDEDVGRPSVRGGSEYGQTSQSAQSNDSVSQTDPKGPISNSTDFKNDCYEECANLLSNSLTIETNMPTNEKNNDSTPDDLGTWNPLVEDFQSGSNSYEIDNENACVMVEGYDPEKVPICKYYMENKCWNGHRCPNLHQAPSKSGEVKLKIPTFSGADISPLPLKEGDWCIARVTNVDEAHNFYVHIVKILGNKNDCLTITESLMNRAISQELMRQSYDMRKYCNLAARRMTNRLQPTIGEVYIVLANEVNSYYRGMVIESEVNTRNEHISVHLIDLGKSTVVQDGFLYAMSPMFMHLPKQAVHCTLWNSSLGKHVLMEKIAKSMNCRNFVMEVNQVCDMTDGPVAVTLYNVVSNRLEKLT